MERPEAFSMIPLQCCQICDHQAFGARRIYRSITVTTGATMAPALAAAATSDPNLPGRFLVFHCFCSAGFDGESDCRIRSLVGNCKCREGLVSSIGGEFATDSRSTLPPASRVIGTTGGPCRLLDKLLVVLRRRENRKRSMN